MARFLRHLPPLLGSGFFTYLLYGYSLGLSFMLDDFDDLPRAASRSVASILASSQGYAYYRPLSHILEKVPFQLQGYFDPFWYHLLPLSLHALNGWLVYLLARRLAGAWAAPWAAALFLSYPFSYQVVPWVGALMHPLMAFLALAAILAYHEGRRRLSNRWTALSLGLALLSAAAHELGMLVGAMMILSELFLWRQGRLPRPSALALLPLAPGAAWAGLWWTIPKHAPPWSLDPNSLVLNGLFFLQGLIYPVAGFVVGLSNRLGWPVEGVAWAFFPASALAMGLIYLWRRAGLFPLFCLAWFALAVLPSWGLLSYAYVIDGPRLLYLASVPASLLWAGLWQLPAGLGFRSLPWRLGLLALAGAILWQSWLFLELRRDLFIAGSRLVWQVADVVPKETQTRTLLVNVPAWFNTKDPEYPFGHLGVTFLPDYLGLDRAVFMHSGSAPDVTSLSYQDLLRPQPYLYGLHGRTVSLEEMAAALKEVDVVYLADYRKEGVTLAAAGWLERPGVPGRASGPSRPFLGDFAGRLRLEEARIGVEEGALQVDLSWLSLAEVSEDLTVFLHLYDSRGRLVAQADGYPLRGLFPFRLWWAGVRVRDSRPLALPSSLAEGDYLVAAGVYDRASGVRLPARDQGGLPYGDGAVPLGRWRLGKAVP